jgi:hypothetical protein
MRHSRASVVAIITRIVTNVTIAGIEIDVRAEPARSRRWENLSLA